MKTVKVQDRTTETLQADLGTLKAEYNKRQITFKNSKGEARTLDYNRVDRNGAFVGDRESEMEQWDSYVAVGFKVQHEQKKAINKGATLALKAGHSVRQGVSSANTRTSRMPAKETPVVIQLAHAQRMAKEIRDIETELAARAEASRLQAEATAKAAADKALLDAMMAPVAKAA